MKENRLLFHSSYIYDGIFESIYNLSNVTSKFPKKQLNDLENSFVSLMNVEIYYVLPRSVFLQNYTQIA